MDLKNFTSAISQIAEEKGISKERVIDTIESAIAAAYKKDYGERGQIIKAKISPESGGVRFWKSRQVLDDSMIYAEEELENLREGKIDPIEGKVRFNSEKHIMLKEAKEIEAKIKVGEDLEEKLEQKGDYGRIAAQTAKQVIMQKIREAEKETILEEYKEKEGEIVSGIVQRMEGKNIYFDIGRTLGVLTKEEQIPQEFYRPGQRLKVYILRVEENSKGPLVFLSRSYPKFISKLFELEVPEVSSGTVEIKSIAREAGSRTKIAVSSNQEGVDPIGSLVGQRGTRISAVINELGGEKIDAIQYSEDPEEYVANSLSPSNVIEVKIMEKNKALAIVPNDQISLAIGKDGQNVRLAAKLTGWKIDVRGPGEDNAEETDDTEDTEKEEDTEGTEDTEKEGNTESTEKEGNTENTEKEDKKDKKEKKEKKPKKVKKEKKPKTEKKEVKKKVTDK